MNAGDGEFEGGGDRHEDVLDQGKLVFWQDWDSGGPGAGAGRTAVYQYDGSYYVFHDAGVAGPYVTRAEAIKENGVDSIGDATEAIWDASRGIIYRRSR